MLTHLLCSKCQRDFPPEEMLSIESDTYTWYFCKTDLKNAHDQLSMRLHLTPDEKKLLKDIRKFLKQGKPN